MADPWLSIIGIGEDGLNGLSRASRDALDRADVVFGGPRHLALAGVQAPRARAWPIPFSTAPVVALRGTRVVVLASGDPFWFGAGGSLAQDLDPSEWQSFPAPSTFAILAGRLGWRIEDTACLGLHAAALATARPYLQNGKQVMALVADPAQARDLARDLCTAGFGASRLWLGEAMGGPNERLRTCAAQDDLPADLVAPMALAIAVAGLGLPRASGLDDDLFSHDGQITKRPIRALALSALRPRPGQRLWDIGAGSGSISVEWCLAGGIAHAVEPQADRVSGIVRNVQSFGLAKSLQVVHGAAPDALAGLPKPDAIFLGGGATEPVLTAIWARVEPGCRLVAHAVTLETEALLMGWQGAVGGDLLKIDLAQASPLGSRRGWTASRTVLQWSVVK